MAAIVRTRVGGMLFALCAAWSLAACTGADPVVEATSTARPVVEATTPPPSPPSPAPTQTVADLDALRASELWVEFAEAERAMHAPGARLAWDEFAVHVPPAPDGTQQPYIHWTNKEQLWNELAPSIRDELLLLGEPYTDKLWESDQAVTPAGVGPYGGRDVREGRIGIFAFSAVVDTGSAVFLRHWPVLMLTRPDGSGEVIDVMAAFDVDPTAFPEDGEEPPAAMEFRATRDRLREWADEVLEDH